MMLPFKSWLHTITSDNGKEFAKHEKIAETLDIDFFFCNPYSSWERGLNENTNGLIRQYFPMDARFYDLKHDEIAFVKHRLNTRPRKCLPFSAPMVFLNNHGFT